MKQCLHEEGPHKPSTPGTGRSPSPAAPHALPKAVKQELKSHQHSKDRKDISAGVRGAQLESFPRGHWGAQHCSRPRSSLWTQSWMQPDTARSSHCLQPFNTALLTSGLWSPTTGGSGSEKQQVLFSNVSSGCSLVPGHRCHPAMSPPCGMGATVTFENIPWEPAVGQLAPAGL